MAQPITCDICKEEQAVIIITSLTGEESPAVGPACLPGFLGQAVLSVMDAGEHKGLPQKCQACRRVHERMTLGVRPPVTPPDDQPANVKNGPGPARDQAEADQADDVEREETGLFHGSDEEAL